MSRWTGLLAICIMMCGITASSVAADMRFATTSFSRGRAIAMGGAAHSLVDDFSAGLMNPGAFRLNKTREESRFRLFLNPLGMTAALTRYGSYDRDMMRDNELTVQEGLLAASLLVKGFVFTTPVLDLGINLGEELLTTEPGVVETEQFFSVRSQARGSMYSAFANAKIASSVSLGITGTLYHARRDGESETGGGYTFGVLLNPNPKLNVGIAYHELPDTFEDARFELENIESGTVTGGISYHLDNRTTVAIDLRNLNKDDKRASREIHTGIEHLVFDRIALRGGYYRKKETDHDVYSAGIGVLPRWERISKYRNAMRTDMLTYTWVVDNNGDESQWHVFSLLLRF